LPAYNFIRIAMNNTSHGVAIDALNRLHTWGPNNHHRLGRGLTAVDNTANLPGRITQSFGGPANDLAGRLWENSMGSGSFGFAIENNGELWAWGHNQYGQLGDRSSYTRNRPVQIFRTYQDPGATGFFW